MRAQDLEQVGKKDPLKIAGGLSATSIAYHSLGQENRRDPFTWVLNGNLNIDLYGWSVPISFSVSDFQGSFRQPFNQYGLSPTYKWITAHLGYRTMTFSPYTLSGHLFLGGGIELTPDNCPWSFSAMYGRLRKAVGYDSLSNTTPQYKRMAYGAKLGYKKNGSSYEVICFRGKDDPSSLAIETTRITPAENLILGLNIQQKITNKINLTLQYAGSAFTEDIRHQESDRKQFSLYELTGPLFTNRISTSYQHAIKGEIQVVSNLAAINIGYERIDPNYRSMGTYFFNNDLENITLGINKSIFNNKLNLATNIGRQRNNLDQTEITGSTRLIGNINLSYMSGKKWNVNLNYSNFTMETKISQRFDPLKKLDSLEYFQVSQNLNSVIVFTTGPSEKTSSFSLNTAFQQARSKNNDIRQSNNTRFFSGNMAYRYFLSDLGFTIGSGVNGNITSYADNQSLFIGPTITLGKTFLDKKIKLNFSSVYNTILENGKSTSKALSLQLNTTITFLKKHNLSCSIVTLRKSGNSSFTEITGNFTYSVSFDVLK